MKKKFVSYLVLAGAVFGLAMVGSCKDYEYDVLQEQINGLNGATGTTTGTLANRITALETEVAKKLNNPSTSSDLSDSLSSIYTLLEELTNLPAGSSVGDLKTALNTINEKLAGASSIADVEDNLEDLKLLWGDSLRTAYKNAYIAKNLAEKDSAKIDTIFDKLAALVAAQDTLVGRIELSDSLNALEARYQEADAMLALMMFAVYMEVEELKDSLSNLYLTEKKRITSLYVQGAMNPIFGTFALPAGIRTNILAAYAGTALNDTKFPLTVEDADNSAIVADSMLIQKSEKIAFKSNTFKNMKSETVKAGSITDDAEDNAGRIFVTVNPNEVEIDDTYTFKFVTSDGNETPATIGKLVPSQEKLTYGWTRAAGSTGFYEAPVKIENANVSALAPTYAVTKDELLDIAKSIIGKKGINLTGVAKAVYTLAQTKLDANAVKVEWSDSLGDHSVTSQYDVAVTAFQPLSFNAMTKLRDISTDFRIPTISPLSELSIDIPTFKGVKLDDITFSIDGTKASIEFGDITIDKTGVVSVNVEIPDHVDAYGNVDHTTSTPYDVNGLGKILQDVEDALNGSKVVWQANANAAINNIVSQVNKQVDDLIKNQLAGKLDTEINKMLNDVEKSINKSLGGYNKYIDQMNELVSNISDLGDKLNPILSLDGSAFLAPWIMYKDTKGHLHPMSNDKNNPTVFKKGKGGIVLYLTSFNADLLAPSYKKFVAVTKYVKPNGSFETTGNTIKAVNNSYPEYYNNVLEGARYAVPFDPVQAGTYTLYYSAMDYSGFVAAERFYVTVEE